MGSVALPPDRTTTYPESLIIGRMGELTSTVLKPLAVFLASLYCPLFCTTKASVPLLLMLGWARRAVKSVPPVARVTLLFSRLASQSRRKVGCGEPGRASRATI